MRNKDKLSIEAEIRKETGSKADLQKKITMSQIKSCAKIFILYFKRFPVQSFTVKFKQKSNIVTDWLNDWLKTHQTSTKFSIETFFYYTEKIL